MKKTLYIVALLVAALMPYAAKAQTAPPGEWRLHNSFHRFHKKIIDTPNKVYMLSLGLGCFSWSSSYFTEYPILFVYDKDADEIEGYNAQNYLHGNIVKNMWYNAAGNYFIVVYNDYNMDILYTDDRCYNVPGLASAIVPGGKDINSVSFDNSTKRIYMATQFGYLVVDAEKSVIAESHIYGINLKSVARVGDYLLAVADDGLYYAPLKSNSKHNSWSEFKKFSNSPDNIVEVLPLEGNRFIYTNKEPKITEITSPGVIAESRTLYSSSVKDYTTVRGGYMLQTEWEGVIVDMSGKVSNLPGTFNYRNNVWGASTLDKIWKVDTDKGLQQLKASEGDSWTVVASPTYGEYIKPNSPNVFDAGSMEWSDKYGMVITNPAYAHFHGGFETGYFFLISCYKDGSWNTSTPCYDISNLNLLVNTHAGALDPYEEDIIWAPTGNVGLTKFNMATIEASGFYPANNKSNKNITTPKFSADGTLWTMVGGTSNLAYWPKNARLANDGTGFKTIPVSGFTAGAFPIIQPCNAQGASNYVVVATGVYESDWTIIDHKGTLDNTTDDRVVHLTNLVDQDGQTINVNYTYCMIEDPATGRIWVGGDGGVFWFNPAEAFNSNFHANRVKVARNDGTGLADYLLEGASVFCIGIDGAGNKWFGTLGNGVVQTTASGSEILRQFTKENSYLPCNDVIRIGFEGDSNCVWIGTKQGMAQYYSETIAGANDLDDILAYPNPVRPDYFGNVTIKGLMDGTLVKILDASGGLVRELGRSEGGMMLWDLSDMSGRRVPTGVYYVAASTSGETSEAKVTKILVMN